MQSSLPKQFMLLLDVPILMHTIERFAQSHEDMQIVVVLPSEQIPLWNNMCKQMVFDIPHMVAEGGDTRYESVKNGLALCGDEGVVGIHDGVRPMVSPEFISTCFESTEQHGSALPVIPITQSLRKRDGEASHAVSREGMVAVQTPQCFRLEEIKRCYDQPFDPSFTDDATVFEKAGHQVHLIDGEQTNIKITTQGDLQMAEALLNPGKKGKR